jgi:hypothetical protein
VSLTGPLNAFGHLLLKHCERQGKTLRQLSKLAGLKGSSGLYYAIRPRGVKRKGGSRLRSTPLGEADLVALSRALRLSVEAEQELVITAQIENAPERLRLYIRQLESK